MNYYYYYQGTLAGSGSTCQEICSPEYAAEERRKGAAVTVMNCTATLSSSEDIQYWQHWTQMDGTHICWSSLASDVFDTREESACLSNRSWCACTARSLNSDHFSKPVKSCAFEK